MILVHTAAAEQHREQFRFPQNAIFLFLRFTTHAETTHTKLKNNKKYLNDTHMRYVYNSRQRQIYVVQTKDQSPQFYQFGLVRFLQDIKGNKDAATAEPCTDGASRLYD